MIKRIIDFILGAAVVALLGLTLSMAILGITFSELFGA
jgi:hypothetical protein